MTSFHKTIIVSPKVVHRKLMVNKLITIVLLKKYDEFDLFDMQEEIKKEFLQDELTEEVVAKLADCPVDHLELVTKLSMKADLTFNNLAHLSEFVPNLKDLKLNGSIVLFIIYL